MSDFIFMFILLHLALIPLVGFIYRYARWTKWTSTHEGRALMFQKFGFLAIILLSLLHMYLNPETSLTQGSGSGFYIGAREVVFTYIVVMFWVMFINLLRAQIPTIRVMKQLRAAERAEHARKSTR